MFSVCKISPCPLQKPLVTPCISQVAVEVNTVRPQLYYTEEKRNGLPGTELGIYSGETLNRQLGDMKTMRVNIEDLVKVKENNIDCSPIVHKTRHPS